MSANGFRGIVAAAPCALLLPDAAAGDPSASIHLADRISGPVGSYCRARLSVADDHRFADRVAKSAVLSVMSGLSDFDVTCRQPFAAFVYEVVADVVNQAEKRVPASVPWSTLTTGERDTLVLRLVVGLSAEETAQVVGDTAAAVRLTAHQALRKMHTALRGDSG